MNMKNPQEILEALSLLDPTTDDQWTSDGQPRLGALSVLGLDGITRAEVQAAAPSFNRSNTVIPEMKVEEQPSLEDKLAEIDLEREEAQKALEEAQAAQIAAQARAKASEDRLEALRQEVLAMDKRTDTEINQDLLRSNLAERIKRSGDQQVARKLLEEAGLVDHVRSLTTSPIDRAIAERIIQERRKNTRKFR